MKTSIEKATFAPLSVTMVFESEAELNAFAQLMNYAPVVATLPFDCAELRDKLSVREDATEALHEALCNHPAVIQKVLRDGGHE